MHFAVPRNFTFFTAKDFCLWLETTLTLIVKSFAANWFAVANFRSRRTIVRQEVGIKFEFMVNDRSRLANDRSRKNSSRRTHREQFFGRTSVRGERSFAVYVKLVGVGDIFWRTVRQFAADSARIRANSGEFARSSPNVRRTRANVGGVREIKKLANGWRTRAEFARIRASSPAFARVRGERSFARYSALFS